MRTPKGAPGEPLRIVIADDDHDSVLSLSEIFRGEGHRTRGVYRGDQVLAAIVDFGADVALIDLMMPGMSGLDVARQLRDRFGAEAPVLIAVTAWNSPTDKILTRAAGFDEHVGKPYDPNDLLTLVHDRIHDYRSRRSRDVVQSIAFAGSADTLHSRLLRKLAQVLGGIEPVRRELMVPTADMSRWLTGAEPMPAAIFVKATDLLLNSTKFTNGASGFPGGGRSDAADEDSSA
jgi:CheY-like chemotaxis protein